MNRPRATFYRQCLCIGKCDRKTPKCSQCLKQRLECVSRVFKHWKAFEVSNNRGREPHKTKRQTIDVAPAASASTSHEPRIVTQRNTNSAIGNTSRGYVEPPVLSHDTQHEPDNNPPDAGDQFAAFFTDTFNTLSSCVGGLEIFQAPNQPELDFGSVLNTTPDMIKFSGPRLQSSALLNPSIPSMEDGHENLQQSQESSGPYGHQPGEQSGISMPQPRVEEIIEPDISDVDLRRNSVSSNASVSTTMPMPMELLTSVENGFLWHHFINHTAPAMFCYDQNWGGNPWIVGHALSPQISALILRHKSLLSVCLALSGAQFDYRQEVKRFENISSELAREADLEFDRLANEVISASFEELISLCVTAQMLCYYHARAGKRIYCMERIAQHRLFLCKLNDQRLSASTSQQHTLDTIIKGFRYLEIMSNLSFGSPTDLQNMDKASEGILNGNQSPGTELQDSSISTKMVVDLVLAFSPRLVEPLRELGILVNLVAHAQYSHSQKENYESDLEAKVNRLEEDLLIAYDADKTGEQASEDQPELLQCNIAFHAASHLMFYSRLRDYPATAPIMRSKVRDIIEATSKIPLSSRTSAALAFPLFTAGCEAIDSVDRQNILQRLSHIEDYCFSDVSRMRAILRMVWEVRDISPGSSWTSWMSEGMHKYSGVLRFTNYSLSWRPFRRLSTVLRTTFKSLEI